MENVSARLNTERVIGLQEWPVGSTPEVAGVPREIPTPIEELKPAKFDFDLEGEAIALLQFLYKVPLLPLSQAAPIILACIHYSDRQHAPWPTLLGLQALCVKCHSSCEVCDRM